MYSFFRRLTQARRTASNRSARKVVGRRLQIESLERRELLTAVPFTPALQQLSLPSATSVQIGWADVSGESGYKLEYKVDGTNAWQVGSTAAQNATRGTISNLTPGVKYDFTVQAYNSAGSSPVTSQYVVTLVPATPTNLQATATGATSISISWNGVNGATSYKLDRFDSATSSWKQIYWAGGNSYTDSGSQLKPGTTYYYRVAASNAGGDSSVTNYVTVTTRQATTTNAATIADQYYGRTAADLISNSDLNMTKVGVNGVQLNICCANFVSACLEKAGLINHSQHSDSVSGLAKVLSQDLGWKKVTDLTQAKKGDVVIIQGTNYQGVTISHTEIVDSNVNGNLILIGSNNPSTSGGPQTVTQDAKVFSWAKGCNIYALSPA